MSRHRFVWLIFASFALAGCKTGSSLATSQARATIAARVFTDDAAVQTSSFTSGAVENQPLAIDQYLFAKHWTTCATETGALASSPRCSLDAEGASYAHANGWTVTSSPTCATCSVWTIPVAKATLGAIEGIDVVDASHATVAYAYTVTPNEFGRGFGDWTASHRVAFCGPDPAAVGGWLAARHGKAAFVKTDGGWTLADRPGDSFVATFARENDAVVDKPCAQ